MNLRTKLLCGLAALATFALAAQAQVPGVNSTLNSVFTLAYDNSTMKPTYSATIAGISPASSADDICTLSGSATKNIRVRRVIFFGLSTAVQSDPVSVVKRSANTVDQNSGVNLSSYLMTKVPYDSGSSAATAVAEYWQANGSAGTLVGVLADVYYVFGNLTTGVGNPPYIFEFGKLGSPVVLRGLAQQISVNLGGTFVALTGKFNCTFEWTEE